MRRSRSTSGHDSAFERHRVLSWRALVRPFGTPHEEKPDTALDFIPEGPFR